MFRKLGLSMLSRRRFLGAAASVAGASAAAGLGTRVLAADKVIRIGFLAPLTGPLEGIDWGGRGWLTFGGGFGGCPGSLAISSRSLAAFQFLRPAVLNELEAGTAAAGGLLLVVAVDAAGGLLEARSVPLLPGSCQLVETGFSQPAAGIRLLFQGGPFAADNLLYNEAVE